MKKIGFYSSHPLEDRKNWSGTMFKMFEQLKKLGYEIEWIPKFTLNKKEQKKLKNIEKIFNKLFNRGYNLHVNIYKSKCIAKKIKAYLKNHHFDYLFIPTYLTDFAFLETNIPIIYLNDATIAQLINYYPYYSGLGILSKIETKYIEKKMLNNSKINIFSSDWASNYAIENYKIAKSKIRTIKFGANTKVPEIIKTDKNEKIITFLFLAVNWERKRGELAYQALKLIQEKGYCIKMLIIGCNPNINEKWVEIIPFLNKNNPQELEALQNHILNSHFLFVPTKADCTPIAFCEAAGYGLPIISTNTGGVSAHVDHLQTGLLLPPNATEKDYMHEIEKLLKKPSLIKEMSKKARNKYNNELNWEVWRECVKNEIDQL